MENYPQSLLIKLDIAFSMIYSWYYQMVEIDMKVVGIYLCL